MKGNPLVSILCLVYNHEPYLRQCLDGFVMQKTDFGFEAIVHDDASTDNSAAILREYAEKYPDIIKPIYETENQYRKGTLATIMDNAKSDSSKYIAICEGDDYWIDPMKLQKQVDFLNHNDDVSMIFSRCHVLYRDRYIDDEYPNFKGINNCYFNSEQLFEKWIVPTATIICRSKFYQIYTDNRIYTGDIVLNLSMAEQGKVYGMSDYTAVYRINDNGLTISRKHNSLKMWEKYIDHIHFLSENFTSVPKKCYNHALTNVYTNIFCIKYDEGNCDYKVLFHIFKLNPAKAIELVLGKLFISTFHLNKNSLMRSLYHRIRY